MNPRTSSNLAGKRPRSAYLSFMYPHMASMRLAQRNMTAPGSPSMPKYRTGEYTLSTRFSVTVSQQDDAICSASIPFVLRLTIIWTFAAASSTLPASRSSQIGSQCFLNENIAKLILNSSAVRIIHATSPARGDTADDRP